MTTPALDPICERSDLPASMCSHCRGLPWEPVVDVAGQLGDPGAPGFRDYREPAAPAWPASPFGDGHGMQARFNGPCPGCGEPIEKGDRIVQSGGRYVCVPCAENDEVLG